MAYRNDDFDPYDNDAYYHGGGRGHYGNTSGFDTTLISDDGRFFGVNLSPEMATEFRRFYPAALDWLRRKVEHGITPLAKNIARRFVDSDHKAAGIAGKVVDAAGYATIFAEQGFNSGRIIYDSLHSLNDLKNAVKPLYHSSGSAAPISGNNEVVANARSKINGIFWQRMLQTGTSTLSAAPALALKIGEQGKKNALRKTQEEILLNKDDPEALSNILLKETHADGDHHNVDSHVLNEAVRKATDKAHAEFEKGLESYKAAHVVSKTTQLQEVLSTLTPSTLASQLGELERHGLDTHDLRMQIESSYRYSTNMNDRRQQIFAEFIEGMRSQEHMERQVDRALRREYEERYGSLKDKQERIRQNAYGVKESQRANEHTEHTINEQTSEIGRMAAGLGAGIAADYVTKLFGGKGLEEYAKPITLDRILHLRRTLEKAGDHPPELVPGMETPHGHESDISYTRFVHEIFQQHQRDSNRPEIGVRFVVNFDNARWDDEAIQSMPDSQLTAYEFAVKTIAQRIKSGRMDAIALIELVGDKRKKIVSDDGRSFGPAGTGKDEAAAKQAIEKVIDEKTALLHAGQKQTEAEINDKLGNFVFSVDDLKKALESDALDKSQRAFIFTMFSDVVGSDEKLCKKLGINMECCQSLRKECKERFTTMLDGAVNVLAEMIENGSEALDGHLKLSDKEKELILAMAEQARAENKHVADVVKSRDELNVIERSAANAAMTLGRESGAQKEDGFWQRMVAAATRPQKNSEPGEVPDPLSGLNNEERARRGYMEREINRKSSDSPDFSLAP